MVDGILKFLFKKENELKAKCLTVGRTSTYEVEQKKFKKNFAPLDYEYLMGRGRFYSAMFNVNNQR